MTKISPECAVEFRNVSISFDEKRGIEDVSFCLKSSRMICITGASGSGKSVLLRIASGLLIPDSGEVLIAGRPIQGLDEQELLAVRGEWLGIVFQEPSLFTSMTVYDNTAYRLHEHGWPQADVERAVMEILRFVGLEEEVDKLPEELSVGMGRRLEFARAFVGWPRIILFDEATSGLDPINARIMLDLMIRARDIHQISCLYVTKEVHEIPYLASHAATKGDTGEIQIRKIEDRVDVDEKFSVLVLQDGRVAFRGTSAEFEATDLQAVTRLIHPTPGAPATDTYIADPWKSSKNRFEE
ncbi:MAG TPA: ATP-binding cassette domain-containing protein [Blastocatellia bacterium]|nr:ATP-binding cassette domain-containing protein [Blastocatellia bacterium]